MAPQVTVITVCRNARESLAPTIESVAAQQGVEIQYVLIDGASTDGTQEMARRYEKRIDVFVSEPDKGIYDAMNKGIGLAKGDLLYFLNAKDVFHDEHVVRKAHAAYARGKADLLYGDIIERGETDPEGWRKCYAEFDLSGFLDSSLCHQAVFASARAFQVCGVFDTTYRVAGDLDWLLRAARVKRLPAEYLPFVISIYDNGGISSLPELRRQTRSEMARAIGTNFSSVELFSHRVMRRLGITKNNRAWGLLTGLLGWQLRRQEPATALRH